ncbi:hypothetical protein ACFYYN_40220 [Streptomyces sp. NPDC001902]
MKVGNDAPVHADDQVAAGVSADLAVLVRNAADDRPVKIASSVCGGCGGRAFVADSEEFETAVAFSLADDGSVRRVTVGLRCQKDGAVGVHADRKIDYGPADHLLSTV